MTLMRQISGILSDSPTSPELTLARWRALSRQVPLLYAMLVVNTVLLASTHFGVAPAYLTLYVPGALTLLSLIRSFIWLRDRKLAVDPAMAARKLRMVTLNGGVLAVGFTAWALSLFPMAMPICARTSRSTWASPPSAASCA